MGKRSTNLITVYPWMEVKMSRLVRVLYPLPDARRSPLTLLRWWESRRLFYNLVVGSTGLCTVGGLLVISLGELNLQEVLVPITVYAVAANICYSLGWLTEMLARVVWGDEAPEIGPLLFRQGLIFSVGLTLLPLIAGSLLGVARLVVWLLP